MKTVLSARLGSIRPIGRLLALPLAPLTVATLISGAGCQDHEPNPSLGKQRAPESTFLPSTHKTSREQGDSAQSNADIDAELLARIRKNVPATYNRALEGIGLHGSLKEQTLDLLAERGPAGYIANQCVPQGRSRLPKVPHPPSSSVRAPAALPGSVWPKKLVSISVH